MHNVFDFWSRKIAGWNGSQIAGREAQRAVLRVFARQTTVNAAMTLVTACITLWFLFPYVPLSIVLPWWFCLTGLSAYYLIKYVFRRKKRTPRNGASVNHKAEDLSPTVAKACLIAGFSGLLWGVGVFFLPYLPIERMPFVVIVAGAMAGGAATTLAALPVAANAFIISSIVPYAVYFTLLSRDDPNIALGLLAMVMTIGLLWSTKLVHGSVLREIELRDTNESLITQFLSERTELLDTVFEADAYALFDSNSKLQMWNAKLASSLGFDEAELSKGMPRSEVLSLSVPPNGFKKDTSLFTSWIDELCTLETWSDRNQNVANLSNGKTIRTTARRTEGGSVVMVFSDLTSERIQQEALQSSQKRFEEFARLAQDDLIVLSGDNHIISEWVGQSTQQGGRLWQVSPVGTSILDHCNSWVWANDLDASLPELLEDRVPFRHVEFFVSTADGERWKQVSGVPTNDITSSRGYLLAISDVTQSHVTRQSLDEHQKRLGVLTEMSSEVIWDIDPEGRVRGLLGGGERSKMADLVSGRLFSEVWSYPGQDLESEESLVDLIENREVVKDFDYRVKPVGVEEWQYFRAIGAPTYSSGGEYQGYLIATRDVTSLNKLETERRKQADEINRLTENLSAGVFRIRRTSDVWSLDYINAWLTKEYGFEQSVIEALITGNEQGEISNDGYLKREAAIQEALNGDNTYETRWLLRLPNGPNRWIQERGRVRQSSIGEQIVDGVMSDVTQAVQSEQEILRGRKRVSDMLAVLDVTHDGVAIQDKAGKIIYTNQTARELRSRDGAQPDPEDFVSLLPINGTMEAEIREDLENALLEKGEWIKTVPSVGEEGKVRLLEVSVTRIPDGGAFLFAADVTERKQLEMKEQNLRVELAESQHMQEVGQMAGGIAHDFANIVASVRSFADLLTEDLEQSSREAEYASKIVAACDRASEVVQQILAFARSARFEREPVRAVDAWDQTIGVVEGLVDKGETDMVFSVELADQVIECGQAGFVQVLMNLAVNARDALDGGEGRIHISASSTKLSRDDVNQFESFKSADTEVSDSAYKNHIIDGVLESEEDYVCITVEDNGSGMSQDVLHRILDPYYTTKGQSKGNGLGLSVVRNVVARCKGALVIDSTPGEGSRFTAYIPVSDMEAPDIDEKAMTVTHSAVASGKSARILIVDDEEDLSDVLTMALTKAGHEATNTYSAMEAWEVFQDDPDHWDIIVTDQVMPNMHGTELISKVRELRPNMPIILCTAFSETLTSKSALELGASVFMTKPVILKDLIEKVESFDLA